MNWFLLVSLVVLSLASGQHVGLCPDYEDQIVTNFDVNAYLGQWYEIYRLPAPFEVDAKCVNADYSFDFDSPIGSVLKVNNTDQVFTRVRSSIGLAVQADPAADNGALYVTFNSSYYGEPGAPNYNVLNTDYEHYSLVYYCESVGSVIDVKIQFAWILSRKTTLDQVYVQPLFAQMEALGVSRNAWHKTDQTGCVQYQ